METIKVPTVLEEGSKVPSRATDGSAGYDLICPVDTNLNKGRGLVKLNLRIQIPKGVAGIIKPRSGFELKGFVAVDKWGAERRIDCDVMDGVIDSDYRGIVGVIVNSKEKLVEGVCKAGTRIAQMLFVPVYDVDFEIVQDLETTERQEGGFNSSGTH